MNLAFIPDTNPVDPASVHEFLDYNALAHQSIHSALLERGFVTSQFPLTYDAIDHDFLRTNAAECRDWADAIGLGLPPDLSTVDPDNRSEMLDWLNNYQNFMTQVSFALGL